MSTEQHHNELKIRLNQLKAVITPLELELITIRGKYAEEEAIAKVNCIRQHDNNVADILARKTVIDNMNKDSSAIRKQMADANKTIKAEKAAYAQIRRERKLTDAECNEIHTAQEVNEVEEV